MDNQWTVKRNSRVNEEVRIVCSACKQRTKHRILASIDREAFTPADGTHIAEQYEVVECCGCEAIAFRQDWQSSEEQGYDDETNESFLFGHEQVFPFRLQNRSELREAFYIPPEIRSLYSETLSALLAGQRVLAGIGMRSLIEAVCTDKGAQGANLKQRIDWLHEARTLSSADASILHGLRIMGNVAAHEVKPHTERELSEAFDVIEHLLLGVYVLPGRADHNKS